MKVQVKLDTEKEWAFQDSREKSELYVLQLRSWCFSLGLNEEPQTFTAAIAPLVFVSFSLMYGAQCLMVDIPLFNDEAYCCPRRGRFNIGSYLGMRIENFYDPIPEFFIILRHNPRIKTLFLNSVCAKRQ